MNKKRLKDEQKIFMEIWGVKPTKRELESLEKIGKRMRERGLI